MMQRVIQLYVDDQLCQVCRRCLAAEACRLRAFVRFEPDEPPFLDVSHCFDCRLCVLACAFDAVANGNH